jgi:hypothetical protein
MRKIVETILGSFSVINIFLSFEKFFPKIRQVQILYKKWAKSGEFTKKLSPHEKFNKIGTFCQ